MWLTLVLCYAVMCWVVVCCLVCAYSEEIDKEAGASGQPSWMPAAAVLCAPILMPYVVWRTLPCWGRAWQQFWQLQCARRTYCEYEFIPLNRLQFSEQVLWQFEQHTPAFFELGFELLGDYRLKPEPVQVCDRFFRNESGEILGAICALLGSGGVSLISVLEDGTCVHTSSVANPHPERTLEPDDRLCVSYRPGETLWQLHRHHLDTLAEVCRQQDSRPVRFRRDQFREMAIYDQRIFCRWRYRHGGLDQQPPPADLGSLMDNYHSVRD
jgi:hypothetical protein